MSRTTTRLLALGAAVVAIAAAAAPAGARSTLLDDEAPILRRAAAAGLHDDNDNLWQTRGAATVFAGREVASVSGSALAGRSASAMAAVLRRAVLDAGGHYAVLDEGGPVFRGADGDALAAAFGILGGETAHGVPGTLARRVHVYVASAAGTLLTDPAFRGLRAALSRSAGLWIKTAPSWTPADWLTWPAETARQAAARGPARSRVHVTFPAGDQAALWARARAGSACAVLATGPGGFRVGGSIEAFAAQYRRTFPFSASSKSPPAGCTAVPVLSGSGAASLVAAAGHEATGLAIPPGGLITPPLVAGEPAQVTLQLGSDPLGLAAGLGVEPEALWTALDAVVQVRGPGVVLDAPIAGDGSAALAFTPTAPGPVSMRLVVPGLGVSAALGGPADLVEPLAAAAGGMPLLARVVAAPDTWSLGIPLIPDGGTLGDPVLVIVPPVS